MELEYLDTLSVYAHWVYPLSYGEELDTDDEREREEFREFVEKYDSADYHLHFNDEEYFQPYPDYGKLAGTCVDVDIYKVTEKG